jgi:mono/diheme cytochrome c family protein
VTEIPEHLLKRSRERREAAGLPTEGGEAAATTPTPAAATPAKAAAAPAPAKAAAPAAPPPPKPVPAYVQAATTRRKMPFWAMSALGLLPIWGVLYARGLTPSEETLSGPLAVGEEVYGSCSSCHGADGAGGVGRPLSNGEVLLTFPRIEDMLNLVYTGSQAYAQAGLDIYGDPNREGGAHQVGYDGRGAYMPQQGSAAGGALSDAEILGVVCHERYTLGGADPLSEEWLEEFETWCSPESEIFLALEEGAESFEELEGVGIEPRPALPPAAEG